jgi:hypothetical protein
MRKTTRRQALWLGAAAAPALAAGALPAQAVAPQEAPRGAAPAEELGAARKSVQQRHERLAAVELKYDVEPAFHFRAG